MKGDLGALVVNRLEALAANLYGSRDSRAALVGIEEALRAPPTETFEPFIGSEVPPSGDAEGECGCEHQHALVDCPEAEPCEEDGSVAGELRNAAG